MDYITKPATRRIIRGYAKLLREIFGIKQVGRFPVLRVLDELHKYFDGCTYEIVSDDEFPMNKPARCVQTDDNAFIIEIKESVYKGAYEKRIGAYMGFICHEICHVFLFSIGHRPIYERSFKNKEIKPYESVEWQAMALSGEVMIPYEESKGMSRERIIRKYIVSKEMAKYRIAIDDNKKSTI